MAYKTIYTMRKVHRVRKAGTMKSWQTVESVNERITEDQYRHITSYDTCAWFRRLGSSQHVTRAYTSAGYLPVRVSSTSPDKRERYVYEFDIDTITYDPCVDPGGVAAESAHVSYLGSVQ